MLIAFQILGMLGFLAAGAAGLWIIISAFRDDGFFRGILVIFLPFYILIYTLFSYDGPRPLIVKFLFFGGLLFGIGMFLMSQNIDPSAPIFR